MKFTIFVFSSILLLLFYAFVMAYYGLTQFEYVPFLGNLQYFCAKGGVEYIYFAHTDGPSIVLHVDREGKPIPCESKGFSL